MHRTLLILLLIALAAPAMAEDEILDDICAHLQDPCDACP